MSETRYPLFDRPAEPIKPRDPSVKPVDAPRLSRQCQLILDRLKEGPVTNTELVSFAMKYTGRLSDLRKAGYHIQCRDRGGGVHEYRLVD